MLINKIPNIERTYRIGMPQMAMGGLSELWLFKEVGDLHWTMLENGLGCSSSEIQDANGDRLYATFTRFKLESSFNFSQILENSVAIASGKIARHGGGLFFGDIKLQIGSQQLSVKIMSSFTKRSSASSNASLYKGQPTISSDCSIFNLTDVPAIALEHREMKVLSNLPVLNSTEYNLIPQHDINGVNLLYFAAYQAINDICEAKCATDSIDWSLNTSTTSRDISYYSNCDAHDVIIYKLHEAQTTDQKVTIVSTLSRKSDGKLMAAIRSEKMINSPSASLNLRGAAHLE